MQILTCQVRFTHLGSGALVRRRQRRKAAPQVGDVTANIPQIGHRVSTCPHGLALQRGRQATVCAGVQTEVQRIAKPYDKSSAYNGAVPCRWVAIKPAQHSKSRFRVQETPAVTVPTAATLYFQGVVSLMHFISRMETILYDREGCLPHLPSVGNGKSCNVVQRASD